MFLDYCSLGGYSLDFVGRTFLRRYFLRGVLCGGFSEGEVDEIVSLGDEIYRNLLRVDGGRVFSYRERVLFYFETGCCYEDRDVFLQRWPVVRERIYGISFKRCDLLDEERELISHLYENPLRLREDFVEVVEYYVGRGKYVSVLTNLYVGCSVDREVYPFYSVSKTGRIYTSMPNCQGLPVELITELCDMRLFSYDFPYFEVRVVAKLSEDRELLSFLMRGEDVYEYVRKRYGLSDRKEAKRLFLKSLYSFDERYLPFEGVKKWKRKMLDEIKKNQRIRIEDKVIVVDEPYRVWNYVVQTWGAVFMRKFLLRQIRELRMKVHLPRHDGFLFSK